MAKKSFYRNMVRWMAAVCCLVTLTSCYTYETYTTSLEPEYNRMYRNWTKRQVMNKFGAPDRTYSFGSTSDVLVYEQFNTVGLAVEGLAVSKRRRLYREFYFDENDKCYNVKSNEYDTHETKTFSKGKTIGLVCGLAGGLAGFIAMIALIANE